MSIRPSYSLTPPKDRKRRDELLVESLRRYQRLLQAVYDAGKPHTRNCECPQCDAWYEVAQWFRPSEQHRL